MNHSLTIIVPVFGDLTYWLPLAQRAVKSAQNQTTPPEAIYLSRGENLADARNKLVLDGTVTTDRVMFLDADDTIESGFVEAINQTDGDIIQPAVSYDGQKPRMLTSPDIVTANYLICGCPVNTDLFISVGGFDDGLEALEDWEMFGRMTLLQNALVTPCPEAVYNVFSRPNSRNRGPVPISLVPVIQKRLQQLRKAVEESR